MLARRVEAEEMIMIKGRKRQSMFAIATVVLAMGAGVAGCTDKATSNREVNTPPAMNTPAEKPGMAAHTMGMKGMDALKQKNGRDFDIAFLSQMITHHGGAVDMARQALNNVEDQKTKTEAQKIITGQTAEIKQMTGWLKQWYATEPSKEQQDLMRDDMSGMMSMPVTTSRMFYAMMIPHHQSAVDMSKLALERSSRPEVRELAAKMIKEQTAEIARFHAEMGHGSMEHGSMP